MIRIWQFLIHGCWHQWGEPEGNKVDHYDISFGLRSYMYTTQYCRCKKCGKSSSQRVPG